MSVERRPDASSNWDARLFGRRRNDLERLPELNLRLVSESRAGVARSAFASAAEASARNAIEHGPVP